MKLFLTIALSTFLSLFTVNIVSAATFTVNNTNDSGVGSLRQAVLDANLTEQEDVINFDNKVFNTPKIITLTTGEISIFYSLTINGSGTNLLTISGNDQSRIFYNNSPNSIINIDNLTLTRGSAVNGGAMRFNATVKLSKVLITNNKAMGYSPLGFYEGLGGGIYSTGTLTIINSVVSDNIASGVVVQNTNPNFGDYGTAGGGGGIFSYGFQTRIVNCTFTNNTARGISSPTAGEFKSGSQGGSAYGGAVYGEFSLSIINSSFTNNSVIAGNGGSIISTKFGAVAGKGGEAFGGAVNSSGSRILNSTFENNTVTSGNGGTAPTTIAAGNGGQSSGGGIFDREIKIANSTIVNNSVIAGTGRIGGNGFGGGIFGTGNRWTIINSTVTGNNVTGGNGTQIAGLIQGGGVFANPSTENFGNFSNNIVAENTAASGTDVYGYCPNAGNNLIRIGEGSSGIIYGINGNIVGNINSPINPLLGTLANNGGVTKTRLPLAGSPAINAGNNSFAINPLLLLSQPLQFDQRNFQRIEPIGGVIDIGSSEVGASILPVSGIPDLRNTSDTGLSNTDNVTTVSMPVFEVQNVIPGAKVELLRDNIVVSAIDATDFSVFMTDSNAPRDGIVQYATRQTIGGVTSTTTATLTVTFDNTPPTYTINQASTQSDPATTLPILFTLVCSERIGGLISQNISLGGSTADVSSAFISVNYVNPTTIEIQVSNVRTPGQVVLTVAPRAVYDLVLNYADLPTYIDNSVIFQPNVVTVSVSGRIRRTSGIIKTPSTVTLTDNLTGESWSTRTNGFGYYRFLALPIYQQIGRRFTVRIDNKSFNYVVPQQASITGNNSNLNYVVP